MQFRGVGFEAVSEWRSRDVGRSDDFSDISDVLCEVVAEETARAAIGIQKALLEPTAAIGHNGGPRLDVERLPGLAIDDWTNAEKKRRDGQSMGRKEMAQLVGVERLLCLRQALIENICRLYRHNHRLDAMPGLLVLIQALSDNDEGCCWLSVRRLAEMLARSERAVGQAFERAVQTGLLRNEKRPGHSNRYWLVAHKKLADMTPLSLVDAYSTAPIARGRPKTTNPPKPASEVFEGEAGENVRSQTKKVRSRAQKPPKPASDDSFLREDSKKNPSPPPPRKRGATRGRGEGLDEIIEEMKAKGHPAHVFDAFVLPVTKSLTVRHPSPRGLFEQTCKLLAQYPAHLLEIAARQMALDRKVWVSAKDLRDPIRKAMPFAKQWRIRPEMPEHWAAWKAYHLSEKGGKGPDWVRYCETGQGYFFELTEWPPGHYRSTGVEA